MCAQTRPRFILSADFKGMDSESMLTPREKCARAGLCVCEGGGGGGFYRFSISPSNPVQIGIQYRYDF